jgi:hypothetical protein
MSRFRYFGWVAAAAFAGLVPSTTWAYVEAPQSLGSVIQQSTHIMSVVVEKVDKEKNLIIFRKLEDLKSKHPTDVIRHNIGRAGFHPREWQYAMEWAEPGKIAVFFHNGGASETCIGNYWYQAYPGGDWWNMSHGEPFLLRSFAGKPEKLIPLVRDILAGKEVVAPCMIDGNKEDLALKRAKVQRLKASLKLLDYNPKRDFAGWGGEDLRALSGMPGFTHLGTLGRADPEAQAISVADVDGDGKPDLCLIGGGKLLVLQNGGDAYSEISLPGVSGCRAAVWADYNADGKPDLLLATAQGPRLFTNLGGTFRDDTSLLPSQPGWNLTAAAWIDADGDGKPDILLANGYHGLLLFRNNPPPDLAAKMIPPKLGEWNLIGPFDDTGRRGFDTAYPPEKEFDLTKEYPGKGNTKVRWRKENLPDGQVHSLARFPHNSQAACYLSREIECATATEMPISLGSDDTLSVWLNGERLLHENVDRPCAPDQNQLLLKLKAGKNRLLLKICQGEGEWAFYFKAGEPRMQASGWFQDVSASTGLGPNGLAAGIKGDALLVADVNGDGRSDLLYAAANGLLVLNTPQGFVDAGNSGLTFQPGKVSPTFGDFNGDGFPDLVVPHPNGCKLFRNDGTGRFADVTAETGDLAKSALGAVCAAWGDFDNDGRLDLVLGCIGAGNRYLRNLGDGRFADQSEEIGLTQKRFNTQAIMFVDLNQDGTLDLVMANEGQESVLLLGKPVAGARTAVTLALKGSTVGSRATVVGQDGKPLAVHEVSGGDGRGGQRYSAARFALPPGNYKIEVRDSTGKLRSKDLTVADRPMRVIVD